MAKIMLAEDDVTMVGLLKTLLKMDGFDVVALEADADVPTAVKRDSPDVLLMDVHLSRQNGLKILDSIRKADGIRNLRIIMISGMNLKDECLQHGADGFLLKPFMPDELMKMITAFKKP
ncbi:MAG TPA: response regulator [Anaerolineales bacterium]|nr:response regulator [Anaerolineales bacterium]